MSLDNKWILVTLVVVALAAARVLMKRSRIKRSMAVLKDAAVIDVRTPGEFSSGHYPGAVNIPLSEIARARDRIPDTERPVIVYCHSGARSAVAARQLRQAGYESVVNAGGLVDMPTPPQ